MATITSEFEYRVALADPEFKALAKRWFAMPVGHKELSETTNAFCMALRARGFRNGPFSADDHISANDPFYCFCINKLGWVCVT